MTLQKRNPADFGPSNDGAKVGDRSRTYRSVTYCAVCDALETMHEIRGDGTRGKRLGTTAMLTVNPPRPVTGVLCPGYVLGRTEERPPEDELRRRLAAVLELHHSDNDDPAWCMALCEGDPTPWPCATARIARGET